MAKETSVRSAKDEEDKDEEDLMKRRSSPPLDRDTPGPSLTACKYHLPLSRKYRDRSDRKQQSMKVKRIEMFRSCDFF